VVGEKHLSLLYTSAEGGLSEQFFPGGYFHPGLVLVGVGGYGTNEGILPTQDIITISLMV